MFRAHLFSLSASVRIESPAPLDMPEKERERGRDVWTVGAKFARGMGWLCAALASTWSICAVTLASDGEAAPLLPTGSMMLRAEGDVVFERPTGSAIALTELGTCGGPPVVGGDIMFLRPTGSMFIIPGPAIVGGDIAFIRPTGSCPGPPIAGGDIMFRRPTGSMPPIGGDTVFARAICAAAGGG